MRTLLEFIDWIYKDTIVISIEGRKVTANYKDRSGIARCNPEDVFEFKTGAILAIERLFADMDSIKEGDSVVVTDARKCYTTYVGWVTKNIKDKKLIAKYKYDESPSNGDFGTIVKISDHGSWDDKLAYIENAKGCYLISLEGVTKYETCQRKSI